ncbi:MAG TPA: hypothetical protein VIU15_26890 [Streptomyces sp.]
MGATAVAVPRLPDGARLVVPVLAATGGSGRTTVAHLLGTGLAGVGDTVVLDLAPRLASSWPGRPSPQRAPGLASLPPDQPLTRTAVRAACASDGTGPAVLADDRAWHAAPLDLPELPAAWYQLAAIGGWQAVVADTAYPLAHDLLTARHAGHRALTRDWYELPCSVPVLCTAATADGVQALQQATKTLDAEGLPLARTVIALVGTGDGRIPAAVRGAFGEAAERAAGVVQVPYDSRVRAQGQATAQPRARTRQAAGRLTDAVLETAFRVWGRPLPAAPQAAPIEG